MSENRPIENRPSENGSSENGLSENGPSENGVIRISTFHLLSRVAVAEVLTLGEWFSIFAP